MSSITKKRKIRLMILWIFLMLRRSISSLTKNHQRKSFGCGKSLKIMKNTKEYK